jgi:LuxR family transcriptional regulator, maltose regulon positive regulatory protein
LINGNLCDAVIGHTGSANLLERLLRANLFIIPLNDEGRWYRYHHLFAELLGSKAKVVSESEQGTRVLM